MFGFIFHSRQPAVFLNGAQDFCCNNEFFMDNDPDMTNLKPKPCPVCVARAKKNTLKMRKLRGCKPWQKGKRGRPPIYL